MPEPCSIAYFSMEIGLEAGMPTYSGGLGVLAGDTLRAAADLTVPVVAITLLHRKGYFYQKLEVSRPEEVRLHYPHPRPAANDQFSMDLLKRLRGTP